MPKTFKRRKIIAYEARGALIFALRKTFPILLGYLAIGCAFGLIMQKAGYPWYLTLLMSAVIYAGAGQYAAAGMFTAGAGILEIALATFLINARHMVYGIPLLSSYKNSSPYAPYLIFGLTDETFGVLTTLKIPEEIPKKEVYFFITLLNQSYWVAGSLAGFFAGAVVPFDFKGVEFALTALFVVLALEQWKSRNEKLPFVIGLSVALAACILASSKNMLAVSFILGIAALCAVKWIRDRAWR